MTLNILIINKVQKFIAHKKKKKLENKEEDGEDSYEESEPEQNIANVFLEAIKRAKENAKHEALLSQPEIVPLNKNLSSNDGQMVTNRELLHSEDNSWNSIKSISNLRCNKNETNLRLNKIYPGENVSLFKIRDMKAAWITWNNDVLELPQESQELIGNKKPGSNSSHLDENIK